MTDRNPPRPEAPRNWRADFLASVVVFMVALPLCIGIAQACGLPPETGIVTGVVGGILVGLLAGSPLQVSGPAAGLIVLVIQFLDDARAAGFQGAGVVAVFGVAVCLAGAVQFIAGLCRVGQWFRAVSPAVVGGMLAGIGATIIAKQFHVMVDDPAPKEVLTGLFTIPNAVWKAWDPPPGAAANHSAAAAVGLITILVLVFWKKLSPKKLKLVPAAVVGVALAVAVTEAGAFDIDRVPIAGNLLDSFQPIAWPGWDALGMAFVWKGALTFALIASAETLLCAVAVDGMHTGPRTKYDRELAAQGVGNMTCGLLGALPMTGVIVRSSANVEAGATSRLSTILHGVWLLLFVALLPGVLSRIPVAALAAVLVYTGWKLVNVPGVVKLAKVSRSEALIYVATAATIVATDLLTGVVTGIVLSAAKLLWVFSHLSVRREDEPAKHRVHIHLEGAATFLRLPLLAEHLDAIPQGMKVHVHLDRVLFVDHAVLELLMTFQKQYEVLGGRLFVDWERLQAHFHGNGRTRPAPVEEPIPATVRETDALRAK
jgi:MFS superfamily sulfate permease-like transporter